MFATTRQVAVRSEIEPGEEARTGLRILSATAGAIEQIMNVLVFGQGKSGTTVIAKTIQHSLPAAVFLMEPKTEEELTRPGAVHTVVKILHGQWQQNLSGLTGVLRNDSSARFDRIVKIIRDPRDQAISSFFYNFFTLAQPGAATDEQLDEVVALIREKEQSPQTISFASLCGGVNRIMRWRGYSSAWLMTESGQVTNRTFWEFLRSLGDTGHLLRYEDFIHGELRQLEMYLGFPLSVRRELGAYERTRRSASAGNWREFFTPEDVEILRPLTADLLVEMGYPDWDLHSVERLNPDHFSGYLARLRAEARPR